ncbi:drug/metabolite transporter permease [Klebsiella pneumoniae]|nr:drug/metabolite transporter permease [Klebsiella pneumoniae]
MQLTRGVWQMSLAMIISGSIGAFVLLSGLPVTDVVFWRCLIGALTLLVFIVLSRQPFSRLTRFTLALAVIGGAALVVNWLLLFAAYSRISIGMATVVYNTQPFMLVLMGMVLGERVSAVKWGWLLLAFGGLVILLSSELTPAHEEGLTTGVLLALGAAFFYALTAIIARKLHPLPAQHIAFIQVLVGVVMLLPLVHAPELTASFPWRYLLILGIVHTGIMYQLLYSAIQKTADARYRFALLYLSAGGDGGRLSGLQPCVIRGCNCSVGCLFCLPPQGIISAGAKKNPAAAGSVSSRGPVSDGRGQSGICASGIRPARSRYEPDGRTGTAGTGSCQHQVNAENKRHAIQML